jgi:hypothetical protein
MTSLTDSARESLRSKLSEFEEVEKAIQKARQPFDDALGRLYDARELLLESFEGEYQTCECCGQIILGGEPHFRDGGNEAVIYCAACAPTYADWKEEVERRIAAGDDEATEEHREALRQIAAYVDAGGSLADKLPVSPL